MKEFHKARFRNEILLAKKDRAKEFVFMDITADRSNVFLQNFGDLASCVELEVRSHLIPSCFSTSSNLLLSSYFPVWMSFQYAFWCSGIQNFCQYLLGVNSLPQYRHLGNCCVLISLVIFHPIKCIIWIYNKQLYPLCQVLL